MLFLQVPAAGSVLFDSFVPLSSALTSTPNSQHLSLISQAALATGISTETPTVDTDTSQKAPDLGKDKMGSISAIVSRVQSPVLASSMSTGDLGSNLSAFLDISIPEPAGGELFVTK